MTQFLFLYKNILIIVCPVNNIDIYTNNGILYTRGKLFMEFQNTEFEANKAYHNFRENIEKIINQKFSNGDSIRNLEDNSQLALYLWNMPKFTNIEDLKEWLDKEYTVSD